MQRFVVLIVLVIMVNFANAIWWDNGGVYDLDYMIDDDSLAIGGTTTLNVYHGGGCVHALGAMQNSRLNIADGYFGEGVYVRDDSVATIDGGVFSDLDRSVINVGEQSVTTISGGTFSGTIWLLGFSSPLSGYHSPTLTFSGTDFQIGGQDVYGLIDVEELVATGAMTKTVINLPEGTVRFNYNGMLTGVLEDGATLNNMLDIQTFSDGNHAKLILIPEPASLLLLSAGLLFLRNSTRNRKLSRDCLQN